MAFDGHQFVRLPVQFSWNLLQLFCLLPIVFNNALKMVDHHQVKPNSPLALLQKIVMALSKCVSSDQRKHLTVRIKTEYLQPFEPMPVHAVASAESALSSSASSSRSFVIKEESSASQPIAKKRKVQ